MKRLLTCVLTAGLSLFCLASCDLLLADEHTEHTYEWSITEETHQKIYTCGCPTPDIAECHLDENNDEKCDICKYNMPEHEHTGEWMPYNQNSHYYEYTCGCTLPDKIEKHVYNDGDIFCNICGYDRSEEPPLVDVTMEPPLVDVTICLRNLTGCEWLNEITAEDIAEIKIIGEAVGVAPGNLKNIRSSTDEAVIARIFEEYYQLDTRPISKMDGQIDGGSGVTVKFILKDGTAKELYINNGNYRDPDDNYFELLSIPKFKDTDNKIEAYGFITYIGAGIVYDKDNNSVCEISIDELEFVESDGCVDAVVTGYYYTVETEFGTLWFDYSNDLFYLQFDEGEANYREYYRLVGKNLDELIAE